MLSIDLSYHALSHLYTIYFGQVVSICWIAA